MFKHLLLLSVLAAFACASKTRCPIALGKYPFSESKFAGVWHLISGTPLFETHLPKCGKYTLENTKNGEDGAMNAIYTATSVDGRTLTVEGYSKSYKTDKGSLKLGVWKKDGSDEWTGVYKQSVVATDYDTYAVLLACKHSFDPSTKTFGRNLIGQVWSRNETMSKEVQDILVSILTGYDVDPEAIEVSDRSNCM